MKFWVSLVNVPEVDQYVEIAKFAEDVGFHGITVADHLVMPTQINESRYPYTPDGKIWWPDDTPWPDPWVTLAAMGVATRKIRLATNIYLAALRDPFVTARSVAAASIFSGGRVVCGVSAGWIKEEYDLAGIDFSSRGRRLDETLEVLKKLWSAENVTHSGEFFNFENALMSPPPVGEVPVWSGGASRAALARAARNDGWLGVPMSLPSMRKTVETLFALREEAGKGGQEFDICGSPLERLTPELIGELESMGVHNNMTMPWVESPWGRSEWLEKDENPADLDTKKRSMERFAKRIINN